MNPSGELLFQNSSTEIIEILDDDDLEMFNFYQSQSQSYQATTQVGPLDLTNKIEQKIEANAAEQLFQQLFLDKKLPDNLIIKPANRTQNRCFETKNANENMKNNFTTITIHRQNQNQKNLIVKPILPKNFYNTSNNANQTNFCLNKNTTCTLLPKKEKEENNKDDCAQYGEVIVTKLRRFDQKTRWTVMHKLNNILLEASLFPEYPDNAALASVLQSYSWFTSPQYIKSQPVITVDNLFVQSQNTPNVQFSKI